MAQRSGASALCATAAGGSIDVSRSSCFRLLPALFNSAAERLGAPHKHTRTHTFTSTMFGSGFCRRLHSRSLGPVMLSCRHRKLPWTSDPLSWTHGQYRWVAGARGCNVLQQTCWGTL